MAVEMLRDSALARARDGTARDLWRRGRRVGAVRAYNTRLRPFLRRALRPEVCGRRRS